MVAKNLKKSAKRIWSVIQSNLDEMRVLSDEIDDMCTLYLEVLNDLWEICYL